MEDIKNEGSEELDEGIGEGFDEDFDEGSLDEAEEDGTSEDSEDGEDEEELSDGEEPEGGEEPEDTGGESENEPTAEDGKATGADEPSELDKLRAELAKERMERAREKAEHERANEEARATLERLGFKGKSVSDAVDKAAADEAGISVEEYRQKKASDERARRAESLLRQTEYEGTYRADLAALKAEYPECAGLNHIKEMPKEVLTNFARLRNMGVSAVDAYAAANRHGITKNVAAAAKQQALKGSKDHLRSSVPKGSRDTSVGMTKAQMAEARELFGNELSDKEIIKLHKQTTR